MYSPTRLVFCRVNFNVQQTRAYRYYRVQRLIVGLHVFIVDETRITTDKTNYVALLTQIY